MKITGELPLCRDKIQQILDSPIPYSKVIGEHKEAQMCKDLVGTLNEEEVEYAAQGSYAYWLATISGKPPTDEERMRMATREARRHLFKVPYEKACVQIKDTVHFRKEQRIDLVRACFLGDDIVEFDNDEDRAKVLELRRLIEGDLAKQHAYCRGHDKDGLAIMIQRSRTAGTNSSSKGGPEDAEDAFVATVLYTMERAIAVTESHSLGALEKIMVVLDFKTFKSSLAPSWNAIKRVATILQNRYPERLKKLVVIDPPFWMRTMYSLLSPFLDPETKAKFVVVSGDAKKQSIISEFIDVDNAMPFLLPKGKLVDPVDLDCYLKQVPFCQTYAKM